MSAILTVQPSIWSDLKTTLRSVFAAIVATARTTEKVVLLAENEVDNQNELQLIRLDQTKAERAQQLKLLDAQ